MSFSKHNIGSDFNLPFGDEVPTKNGIAELKGNQVTVRECYGASLANCSKEVLTVNDSHEDEEH